MDTDTSNVGIGGVISQVQEGQEQWAAFSICKSITLLLSITKARSITMLMLIHDNPAEGNVPTATSRGKARHQTSMSPGTVVAATWDLATLRTEQLNDPDIWPILQEVETGQQPEWKDIAECSPTYESYWALWKSLAVSNGILDCNWKSTHR
jgi:hypothetical protein